MSSCYFWARGSPERLKVDALRCKTRLFKSKHASFSLGIQMMYSTGKHHRALQRGTRLWKPLWRKLGARGGGREGQWYLWYHWMEVLSPHLHWVLQEKALPCLCFRTVIFMLRETHIPTRASLSCTVEDNPKQDHARGKKPRCQSQQAPCPPMVSPKDGPAR